jgi:hypothetical protein
MEKKMNNNDNLEQRLLKAIDDDKLSVDDLAQLINQTERGIVAAEEAARAASEAAFDPARSADPVAARDEMETAHLRVGRLKTLLPRLTVTLPPSIAKPAPNGKKSTTS